jgi:hypothetical protein
VNLCKTVVRISHHCRAKTLLEQKKCEHFEVGKIWRDHIKGWCRWAPAHRICKNEKAWSPPCNTCDGGHTTHDSKGGSE